MVILCCQVSVLLAQGRHSSVKLSIDCYVKVHKCGQIISFDGWVFLLAPALSHIMLPKCLLFKRALSLVSHWMISMALLCEMLV
jgi:hypothetical protein